MRSWPVVYRCWARVVSGRVWIVIWKGGAGKLFGVVKSKCFWVIFLEIRWERAFQWYKNYWNWWKMIFGCGEGILWVWAAHLKKCCDDVECFFLFQSWLLTRKGRQGPSHSSENKIWMSEEFFLAWKWQGGNDSLWDWKKTLKRLKIVVCLRYLKWNIVFTTHALICLQWEQI